MFKGCSAKRPNSYSWAEHLGACLLILTVWKPQICCPWMYMFPRAPLVSAAKAEQRVSRRADALSFQQSPASRAWPEGTASAPGAPRRAPAHVVEHVAKKWETEFWPLVARRSEEAANLGRKVFAGCGEEGAWTRSCHLLATRLTAKPGWEPQLKLCRCVERNAHFRGPQRQQTEREHDSVPFQRRAALGAF